MNQTEFAAWLKQHGYVFPRWQEWYTSQPAKGDILAAWMGMMKNTDLNDAIEVTRQMGRGEIERPNAMDDMVPSVIREARRVAERREANAPKPILGRQERFSCVRCRDCGWAEVFTKKTVSEASRGLFDDFIEKHRQLLDSVADIIEDQELPTQKAVTRALARQEGILGGVYRDWRVVMIRCSCHAGTVLNLPEGHAPIPTYDPKTYHWRDPMVPDWQHLETLKTFRSVPANYVADFDDWNTA